jgi:hypothetical protein
MIATLTEKLRRLSEMSLVEVRSRIERKVRIAREQWQLRQKGSIRPKAAWWDCWGAEKTNDPALCTAMRTGSYDEAELLLPRHFARRQAPHFFWDTAGRDDIISSYQRSFPKRMEELRAEANSLMARRFRIFSYPEASCTGDMLSRRDLIYGRESGLAHFDRIPYLDFNAVGDSKIVWEPSRHQYLITLCLAYLLTREEKYAEGVFNDWEAWQNQNPHGQGINWASTLEVAFRSWSWLWVIHLLMGSTALTGQRIGEMTAALARNAEFISENLSTYFSPNTHLLGEGFALFSTGLLLPELRGSDAWREQGRAILMDEMFNQVREDGSHFEQSSYYHRYAVEFFLCAAVLAERNSVPFPATYQDRLSSMFDFLHFSSLPSGRDPSLGDADGGRLIPLGPNDPGDWRPLFSSGAVYLHRGELKNAAGRFHEQTPWLLGPEATSAFDRLESAAPEEKSRAFCNAGLVTMRSDWTDKAQFLLLDAGPQGMGGSAHGHADTLGVRCSADDVDWLVDPGTFVYTASRPWRDFFRSTRAHNTIIVDGQEHATAVDFFKWRNLPRVRFERFVSTPDLDFAEGSHDAYAHLPEPLQHRRQIVYVRGEYWILSDVFTGSGVHEFNAFFHFAPGVNVRRKGEGWLASKGDEKFLLQPLAPGMDFRVLTGEESPIQGWYSSDYGHREPAVVLEGTHHAEGPARFHWILMPAREDSIGFSRLANRQECLAVVTDKWTDLVLTPETSQRNARGTHATDADLAYVRRDNSGKLVKMVLLNGSRFELSGIKLFEAESKLKQLSVNWAGTEIVVRTRPAYPFRLYSKGALSVCCNGETSMITRDTDWVDLKGAN